ncbi:hypothetical protein BGZ60DRAFT_452746 [Tricladium varicosporioides]|nr:hypothetical protein BGZ60DRAFT_452746 [Hymenoscyphus varicosporioides]
MAESMCGPSNALNTFQKHTTVDRTLQQDRLVHRQSPSQASGFRSSPNTGILENEFQAFQKGQLTLEPQHTAFPLQPFSHAPQQIHQAGASAWASDFQRLNISSPSPQIHQGFSQQRQQEGVGWHQEFVQQGNGITNVPSLQSRQNFPRGGIMGAQYNSMGYMNSQAQESIALQKQPEEAFDEEAFARAFEEAAAHEEALAQQEMEAMMEAEMAKEEDLVLAPEEINTEVLAQQGRIGADQIHDPASETNTEEQQDPDALARTAGQLLDSVRHEQDNKFQQSSFLELMRQLRDREVVVEGDKIVGSGWGPGTDMEGDAENAVEAVKVSPMPPQVEMTRAEG